MMVYKLMTIAYLWAMLGACSRDADPVLTPQIEQTETKNGEQNNGNKENEENRMTQKIKMRVGQIDFAITLERNATAQAFASLLPLTIQMNELNGNEKYHYLKSQLPTDSKRPGRLQNGDLMLYGSDCLVLFYETFSSSYSYTSIGRVDQPERLAEILGTGNVTVTFEITE